MIHKEQLEPVPGAEYAVLFIHGIVGTPNHFVTQIPLVELVPQGWSVYNLLLPGHGGTVDDFAGSSMEQWKAYVWRRFQELSKDHQKILIVGHSMGTLFAVELARENPDKIPGVFLLAVPMRPFVRPGFALSSLLYAFGKVRKQDPSGAALIHACGTAATRKLWKYLKWIPRFWELFREIRITEQMLHGLSCRVSVWQSRYDEVVAASSGKVLKKHGITDVNVLSHSSHFYYSPEDQELVRTELVRLCKEIKKQD